MPRGTDDAGNDWLVEFPSRECLHMDSVHADASSRPNEASAPIPQDSRIETSTCAHNEAVFLLITPHELSEMCDRLVSEAGRHVIEGHLHDQQGLEKVLDQNLWEKFAHDLKVMLDTGSDFAVTGAIFMQFGTTLNTRLRGTDPMGDKRVAYQDKEALRI